MFANLMARSTREYFKGEVEKLERQEKAQKVTQIAQARREQQRKNQVYNQAAQQ